MSPCNEGMTLRVTFTLRSRGGEGDAELLLRTQLILQLPEWLQLRLQRLKLAGTTAGRGRPGPG
jgi:hypothetical protein